MRKRLEGKTLKNAAKLASESASIELIFRSFPVWKIMLKIPWGEVIMIGESPFVKNSP